MSEDFKRMRRTINILLNLLIFSNFMAVRAFSDPSRWTFTFTAIAWTIFIGTLVAANIWLYYAYYRKPMLKKA